MNTCAECERSYGPHYRGPCEHGGAVTGAATTESNTETLDAAVAMTRGEETATDRGFRVLSIDALREPEGGWEWNAWYDTGERFPRVMIDAKPRAVLRWLRDNGLLSAASAGRMAIDDDGYNIVAIAKGTRKPIFAIEYGSEE